MRGSDLLLRAPGASGMLFNRSAKIGAGIRVIGCGRPRVDELQHLKSLLIDGGK